MKYVDSVNKPCSDCPFRRKAAPGWLGASSPEGFIDCMERGEPLPCHQTIDYDNPHWLVEWMHQKTGKMCAGSLIFMSNKLQHYDFTKLPTDHTNIFSNTLEFVRYHRGASVHSWDDDEQNQGAKFRREIIAQAAKSYGEPIIDGTMKTSKKRKSR
jgi:hypothetical protein